MKEKTNLFIADSGASCHMSGSLIGMTNLRNCNDKMKIADNLTSRAEKIGDKRGYIITSEGKKKKIVLEDCKYVPALGPINLSSTTKAISNGYKLGNEGRAITLKRGKDKIVFDKEVKTKDGYVCAIKMHFDTGVEMAAPALKDGSVNVNRFHELLGHPSESKTRAVAKYYGVKLTGSFKTCASCAKAKARQANIPKSIPEEKRSKKPGERLMFDVSSIKKKSFGGAKFWLLIMDDATGFIWSHFI